MSSSLAVSVVLSTYNRASLLSGAVCSILNQVDGPPFELIVVDNNSSDKTSEVARQLAASDPRVRYCFEPKQGLSHARNAGVAAARAEIIAFTDDDVRADPDWVQRIHQVFEDHPEIGYAGGKVLPIWPKNPPAWLTPEHWSPLALVDYGESPFRIPTDLRRVIVGANLIFRRSVLLELGGFRPELQRVKDGIGSMEDFDIQERYWKAGGIGLYDPAIAIHADVQTNRLSKPYHRRWHHGHGRFHAIRGDGHDYPSPRDYFGVPSAMYRRVARLLADLAKHKVSGCTDRAFASETELYFIAGFMRQRLGKPMPQ